MTDRAMVAAIVCERTGWTYEEYLDQPEWLVSTMFEKWRIEGERQEEQNLMRKRHGN